MPSESSWGSQKDVFGKSFESEFFNKISGNDDAVDADSGPKRCSNEGFQKGGVENRSLKNYRASNTEPTKNNIQDDSPAQ